MPAIRVYGPPGTGKTHWVVQTAKKLIKEGWAPEKIAVLSFSRAAAAEVASRIGNEVIVGTVHSMAYSIIGAPPLALTPEALADWAAHAPERWHITPTSANTVDVYDPYKASGISDGDRLYARVNAHRLKGVPMSMWTDEERDFYTAFVSWMGASELIDFTGMLERALAMGLTPGVKGLIIDEAQDLSPLAIRLVNLWSRGASYVAVVGDDDQAIYGHAGADGEAFTRIPVHQELVLDQSYRLPPRVLAGGRIIASRIKGRRHKEYRLSLIHI